MQLDASTIDRTLTRLGVSPPSLDLAGLARLYGAWCQAVPFDNVQKLLHLAAGGGAPLPGSTAGDFLERWLAHGTGGTCWAGNGALHDLLAALGFEVQRVAATMMAAPDTPPSNHGSVLVTVPQGRFFTDASILSGAPIRWHDRDGPPPPLAAQPLPRFVWRDSTPLILWRTPRAPDGFACRIDHIGISAADWDAFHQRTAAWGPFNYAISARVNRPLGASIGMLMGDRFTFDAAGRLHVERRDRAGRDRFLTDELGVDPALVQALPDDRSTPPPPG